ncbi:hypothetical protein ACROYT_G000194 [Oculina patagonica]
MEMQDAVSQDGIQKHDKATKLWSLIKDFCDYTSAHGLGRIMAATHWTRAAFWTLLLLAAVMIMTLQVHTLFRKYQRRPLTTLVTVETSTSLPFPTVTFCNFNAIKRSSLQTAAQRNAGFLEEVFASELARNASRQLHGRNRRANDDPTSVSTAPPTLDIFSNDDDNDDNDDSEDDDDFWEDEDDREFQDPSKKDPLFLKSEHMSVLMAMEDEGILGNMGHRFEDMVLSCTYRGVPCRNYTSPFWSSFWHYKYGNCYVFNGGKTTTGSSAPILKSNKPGPSHGLNLELNVEQEEYIGVLSPEAGIKMDISTQGQMPFPLERGVSLAPGYATMIGLRKEMINREDPFESKRCLQTVSKDESNLYTKHFGAVYSSTACKESCLAYNELEKCGCMEYRFPGSSVYGICSVTDKQTVKCLSKVQKKFRENKLNCTDSCPPPCSEQGFKMSTSFAIWPSENYEPIYTDNLRKENKILLSKDESHRKNVCKLQVFYEELNLEVITEQRSYEIEDFVSDIGGQLGLWIGFSVLTAAEFLELFMLLFLATLKTCRAKKTPKANQIPQRI